MGMALREDGHIGNLEGNYKGPETIVVPAPPFPRTRPERLYVWATKCQGDQRPVGQREVP